MRDPVAGWLCPTMLPDKEKPRVPFKARHGSGRHLLALLVLLAVAVLIVLTFPVAGAVFTIRIVDRDGSLTA